MECLYVKWNVSKSTGYGEPFNRSAFGPLVYINLGALLVLGKKLAGVIFVTVYLPIAGELCAIGTILDKTANVLGRVSEKQPYFMGEFFTVTNAVGKLGDAAFGLHGGVTKALQQLTYSGVGHIGAQFSGAIDIYQRSATVATQGNDSQTLMRKTTI